jgi:hypothetical protein
VEERDHTSIMMATDSKRLEEAKKMIKRFRRRLCSFMEQCESKNSIYQLSISFFPILKAEGRDKKL